MGRIWWVMFFFLALLGCKTAPDAAQNSFCQISEPELSALNQQFLVADSLAKSGNISASDSVTNVVLGSVLSICTDPYQRYRAHNKLCMNALKDKRLDDAIQRCSSWANQAESFGDSICGYYNSLLGYLYFVKQDYISARPCLERAADLIEKAGRTKKLPSVYNNLAPCLIQLGDYEAAEHYLRAAIRLNAANNDPNRLAINYYNLGRNYNALEQSDQAIDCFSRSAALRGEKNEEYYLGMTKAYFNLGDFAKAESTALQLMKLSKESGVEDPKSFQWLGLIADAKHQPTKAITFFKKALAGWTGIMDTAHYDFGKTKIFLGDAYRLAQQPVAALQQYQSALIGFIPSFSNNDVTENPRIEQLPDQIWVMEALLGKAHAWEQYGEAKGVNDTMSLKYALNAAEMATAAFLKMKNLYQEDASKLNLDRYGYVQFFEKAIQLATRLADLTKNDAYRYQAFYLTQRSKAGVLRNGMQERAALFAANIAPDSIQKISQLQAETAKLDKTIGAETDSLKREELLDERFKLRRQWRKMISWANNYLPKQTAQADLPVPEIQHRLPAESLLLEYFVGGQPTIHFCDFKNKISGV
jgi:tetratricopeptide (TPR) repeat protein